MKGGKRSLKLSAAVTSATNLPVLDKTASSSPIRVVSQKIFIDPCPDSLVIKIKLKNGGEPRAWKVYFSLYFLISLIRI